jgi:hypothetical protein
VSHTFYNLLISFCGPYKTQVWIKKQRHVHVIYVLNRTYKRFQSSAEVYFRHYLSWNALTYKPTPHNMPGERMLYVLYITCLARILSRENDNLLDVWANLWGDGINIRNNKTKVHVLIRKEQAMKLDGATNSGRDKRFFSSPERQNGSGPHPNYYPTGTVDSFPLGKAPGGRGWLLTLHPLPRLRTNVAILHLSWVPSCIWQGHFRLSGPQSQYGHSSEDKNSYFCQESCPSGQICSKY